MVVTSSRFKVNGFSRWVARHWTYDMSEPRVVLFAPQDHSYLALMASRLRLLRYQRKHSTTMLIILSAGALLNLSRKTLV